MTFLGADTDMLRAQAEVTETGAGKLEDLAVRLSAVVNSVKWVGPDAESFRVDWTSRAQALITEALDDLRRRGQELDRNADEQDEASSGDGGSGGALGSGEGGGQNIGGGSLWEKFRERLENYEPLESDGFWNDLLGDNGIIGLNTWAGLTSAADVAGMVDPGTSADVVNLIGDAGTIGISGYDLMQSFQDGDMFGAIDANITMGINMVDAQVTAAGMFPHPVTKGIGLIGGPITGSADVAWNNLTVAAANNPDGIGGGSPSRALVEMPGHKVEQLTGWSGLREGTDSAIDDAEGWYSDYTRGVRDAVPIIDPMIDHPQRVVEGIGSLLD